MVQSIAGDCKQDRSTSAEQKTLQLETQQGSSLCTCMEGSVDVLPGEKCEV